ncbi:hypothetical protein FA95DRAFT_315622 [Auriscalpium vulgare]|uniref:Uncharacterized protein n=1 Tax=Auriscalpium vulgare TaxID=40419 RepID=A0ACB8S613_9AGAM|nr:hypothetical protein FA95DRAFT_315622 [Auriscalpium vulgare]
MSTMKAYLAEKYMSGPKADAILARAAPKKKKKRKGDTLAPSGSANSGFQINDDDGGWVAEEVPEDDAAEAVVASDRAFKKRRLEGGSGWTNVRQATPPPAADEQPVVADVTTDVAPFTGGLLTSKQLRKHLPTAQVAPEAQEDDEVARAAQETVYRDATGRKIDMKAEKAEAARKKREREERDAQKMEWGKGLVQRDEAEERRKQEEKMRTRAFARHADDEDLNREQKDKDRWNDPAAAFLAKKRNKGPRKPEYNGPTPAPNRFGIKPGYRWDGVDRGNGFEKKYFQRMNERKRVGQESHSWSVEDM